MVIKSEIMVFGPVEKVEALLAQFSVAAKDAGGVQSSHWPYPERIDVKGRTLAVQTGFADLSGAEAFHGKVREHVIGQPGKCDVTGSDQSDTLLMFQDDGWSVLIRPPVDTTLKSRGKTRVRKAL